MRLDTRIAGIPCIVEVTYYDHRDPDPGADNPGDFFGYTEADYEVLDRRGYPAPWLEDKVTDLEHERIVSEIERLKKEQEGEFV